MKRKRKGMVYVFTGDGKGKTSAAIGVGVRAALIGKKVAMVCWYKSKDWDVSEYLLPEKLRNFTIYNLGKGFFIKDAQYRLGDSEIKITPLTGGGNVVDRASKDQHVLAAQEALKKAEKLIKKVDVLILDEVNTACFDRLVSVGEVLDLLKQRGSTHVILTGRNAPRDDL